MGCTVREKHVRPSRKTRSVKPEFDPCCLFDKKSLSKSIVESSVKHLVYHPGLLDSGPNPNPSGGDFEENVWGYCTEEQLEDILLKHLECLYNEAISKLVTLGYDEDVALRAILSNGYCYGGSDVLTNILHNSLAYLNSSSGEEEGCDDGNNEDQSETVFTDLRQLEEYSLAGMVYLLQQVKPHLSKGDAMWCLLMSELHVGKASTMDVRSAGNGDCKNVEGVVGDSSIGSKVPASCRFHGGWGFGNGRGPEFSGNRLSLCAEELPLQREIDCPRRFNLSPSMKSLLRENVAAFAAGYRASMEKKKQSCAVAVTPLQTVEQPRSLVSEESVSSVLEKFRDLNLDDDDDDADLAPEELKDDVLIGLLKEVQDLKRQLKERKDWAQKKAMQAAQKVSDELTELKNLRCDREEIQLLKKGKQTREDSTMKRLSDMENALRKASGQVDKANAIAKSLKNENAEIRAEMEAFKLSASESLTACMEASKKEKKCLKKLVVWEKQKKKLQDEITAEKEKIKALDMALAQIVQDEKDYEVKWREEQKAKEQALACLEEEQRLKEATEATNKRKVESLRLKIEIDFQRHKDDHQRLEQELSRLIKASSTDSSLESNKTTSHTKGKTGKLKMSKLLEELDRLDESYEKEEASYDRECLICLRDEVSVVFLPCAHQVVCANCSDSFMDGGKATCPCCRAPVQQRIRVFGATS